MTKQSVSRRSFTVSHAHDPAETQAEKAAEVVARGGSVSGWSFGQVPVSASVHRDETGDKPPKKGTPGDVLEALSQTPVGKQVIEKVKEREEVKAVLGALDTTGGKVAAGGLAVAGLAGFAAAKKELPAQIPAIPVGTIGGYDAKAAVKIEGPVNSPTFVGVTLSFSGHSEGKKKQSSEDYRADTAKLRAQQEAFLPRADKDAEAQWVHSYVAAQSQKLGSVLLPLRTGEKPKALDAPLAEPTAPEKKEEPVQREPASATESEVSATGNGASAGIEGALMGGGRPLDSATRRSMEARFGHDFTGVRIHDHATASSAAAGISARAFTVGDDIVFGSGGYDATTTRGRYLLAHELAHVVQQRGRGSSSVVHRRSAGDSFLIWLGTEEGSWTDKELLDYLGQISQDDKIDGAYDADNKARAIVAKWKAASPGFDLNGRQKVLLIAEMLDGPTLDDDEFAILDLLENSDASDLRAIMSATEVGIKKLESDLDGAEKNRLDTFVKARFQGGSDALKAGTIVVLGDAVPASAPTLPFNADSLAFWLRSDRPVGDVVALLDRMTTAERDKALRHLIHVILPAAYAVIGRAQVEKADQSLTDDQKSLIDDRIEADLRRREKAELILEHYYLASLPASKADPTADDAKQAQGALEAKTKALDPAMIHEVRAVLRPALYAPPAAPVTTPDVDVDVDVDIEPDTTPEKPEKTTKSTKAPKQPKREKKPKKPAPELAEPEKYRAAIKTALIADIEDIYERKVTKGGTPAPLEELAQIAEVAQKATDAVFKRYYTVKNPTFKLDQPKKPGNVHSWYAAAGVEIDALGKPGSKARQVFAARWARYYLQAHGEFRAISDSFGASPRFKKNGNGANQAGEIYAAVAVEVSKDQDLADKMIASYRNWGGMNTGEINVDLFHSTDAEVDRRRCWAMLRTFIHEYLHGLVSKKYDKYAESFGTESTEYNTLIEGVDEVLTGIVWQSLLPQMGDPAFREKIEGKTYAALPQMELTRKRGYESYTQATGLIDLVGFDNLIAAYFVGLIDRISVSEQDPKKADKPKGPTK